MKALVAFGSLSTLVLLTLTTSSALAQEVTIAPKRLIFEGRDRSTEVALVNRSSQRKNYRIFVVDKRMTPEGQLVDVDAPVEWSAAQSIRYSPRRLTLEPAGKQSVRVMISPPADLPPGEYRSHLLFQAEPDEDAAGGLPTADQPNGVSSKLIALYSLSIPVIIRVGAGAAEVSVAEASLVPASTEHPAFLSVALERKGNRSVYGDLVVRFLASGAEERLVGVLRGVAVYSPNDRVRFGVPVQLPPGVGGKVELSYLGDDAAQPPLARYEIAVH